MCCRGHPVGRRHVCEAGFVVVVNHQITDRGGTVTVETTAEAWRRRTAQSGRVDFTMMYVAHDAFRRDLARLVDAAKAGTAGSPEAKATWAMFSRQLHTHHEAEDASLWPRVRATRLSNADEALLDAMEDEHDRLDPLLERLDASFAGDEPDLLALDELALLLETHMRHEETEALPLVERAIGQAGWDGFGRAIRTAQGGLKAGAAYLPWVLDGAPDPARARVLKVLPPPARALYRLSWEPKYKRSPHLT
jgi:iron-sulfur cluster repair protein YtfE (RIC family)